jgi:hypothetical protein
MHGRITAVVYQWSKKLNLHFLAFLIFKHVVKTYHKTHHENKNNAHNTQRHPNSLHTKIIATSEVENRKSAKQDQGSAPPTQQPALISWLFPVELFLSRNSLNQLRSCLKGFTWRVVRNSLTSKEIQRNWRLVHQILVCVRKLVENGIHSWCLLDFKFWYGS